MRQLRDGLFCLRVVQLKLAQKRAILIQHCNSEIPAAMTVGDVNVAVGWIYINRRWSKKLRRIRIERFPFRGAIGGIENTRFPNLKQEFPVVQIFLHEPGTRGRFSSTARAIAALEGFLSDGTRIPFADVPAGSRG
jgi:hypothetical protein